MKPVATSPLQPRETPLHLERRVALLDFDGLIVDTEYAGWRSWHELYQRFGLSLSQREWAHQCGRAALYEPWEAIEARGAVRADLDAGRLQRRDELLLLRPGVLNFLDRAAAQHITVAIVSNSPPEWIERNLARNALPSGRFQGMICGPGYAPKPSPERYLAALAAFGVDASEAIAVEDSTKGVEAAVAAGLDCIAVPNAITQHGDLSAAHTVLASLDLLHLAARG